MRRAQILQFYCGLSFFALAFQFGLGFGFRFALSALRFSFAPFTLCFAVGPFRGLALVDSKTPKRYTSAGKEPGRRESGAMDRDKRAG